MNKYEYVWVVQGYYQRWEDLTASPYYREAKLDLKAYRNNEPGIFRLIQRRILNGDKLESYYHCFECGHEGFAEDCQLNDDGCNECQKGEGKEI